jgi:hypothetical protein
MPRTVASSVGSCWGWTMVEQLLGVACEVEDHVDPVGVDLANGLYDVAGVIDGCVSSQVGDQRLLLVGGCGGGDYCGGELGQLYGLVPDAAGGAGDQDRLAGLELGCVR